MMNTQTTSSLVQTWVSVVDERGRAHLEAHWSTPATTVPTHVPSHSHAA